MLGFCNLHSFYFLGIKIQQHKGNDKHQVWVSVLGFCIFFLGFDFIFGSERQLRVLTHLMMDDDIFDDTEFLVLDITFGKKAAAGSHTFASHIQHSH